MTSKMEKRNRNYYIFLTLLLIKMVFGTQLIAQEATINVDIQSNNALLKGTLFTPNKNKVLPLVIIIPGSGKQARKDFEKMVKFLFSGLDMATFIYDKRGIGESTGIYEAATAKTSKRVFKQRSKDVQAIVDVLKNHPSIDSNKIGLMGSSQGSWIITMVASKDEQIAFTICASGSASSVGVSDFYDGIAEKEQSIEDAIEKLEGYKDIKGFDPYNSIKKMNSPALWIYGGQDKSNPTARDVRIISEIKNKYNKQFYIHLYPSMDHNLIDTTTGEMEAKFVPELRDWIQNIIKE